MTLDNYMEISNRIIDLTYTLEEALNHIKLQISELRYEEALMLFIDTIEGIRAIETSLGVLDVDLGGNMVYIKDLIDPINKVILLYKISRQHEVEDLIVEVVLPRFYRWKEDVDRVVGVVRLN